MKSRATPKFWKLYRQLPKEFQRRARRAYVLWKKNPDLPGLQFKRVSPNLPVFSARVTDSYRVLGIKERDILVWFWIGEHDEYERLLKQLA